MNRFSDKHQTPDLPRRTRSMKRRSMIAVWHIAVLTAASAAAAAEPRIAGETLAGVLPGDEAAGGRTEPPFTYVLDYGSNHLGSAEWHAAVAKAPPDLLHLGKDVPMTHQWGPIRALGGENQAHGKDDDIIRLTPEEVRQRMAGLKQMVDALHRAGVKQVMPYICTITVAGHHEQRAGFWAFYDHWDDYAARFGLGTRPDADPAAWLQRDARGGFQRFYKYMGSFYPPFEPNHRYAACVNSPHWQRWLEDVVTLVAQCGFDGVFTDNGASQRCYCDICRRNFRPWTEAHGLSGVELEDAVAGKPALYEAVERFWMQCLHEHQLRLRAAGQKCNPAFRVFPNGGHNRPHYVKLVFRDSDYVMFEKSIGQYGTHPGLVSGHVNHDVVELKYVQCLRAHVRPMILTRPGYPQAVPQFELNSAAASLGQAEVAAFSNGGGFLLRPNAPETAPTIKRWRAFFARNADLYRGNDSFAVVGLAFWSEQLLAGNKKHLETVKQITEPLLAGHIPFDYVVEESCTADFLRRYSALILADIDTAPAKQLAAIADWVRVGGHLLLVGAQPENSPLPAISSSAGRGSVTCWASVQEESLTDWLRNAAKAPALLPGSADRPELDRVYVNMFARPGSRAGDLRLAVHLVNYNVPLGLDAPPPKPLENVELRVPLPHGLRPADVAVFDPDADGPEHLSWHLDEGTALVKLPSLRIYKLVLVNLEQEHAAL